VLNNYKDVMNVSEMAAVLRIGKNNAYKLLHDGIIPSRKIGRKYLIPKRSVIAYLNNICYNCSV